MNNKDEILKNPDLRQALSLAINRQAICDTVYEGVRMPATSIVPEGIAGYEAGAWQYSKYDVEAAKAKLAEAGYPERQGPARDQAELQHRLRPRGRHALVQADLGKIGVSRQVRRPGMGSVPRQAAGRRVQVGRLGWIADYPIIDNFLFPLFTPGWRQLRPSTAIPPSTAALMDARKTVNTDERIAKYQAIVKTIGDDCSGHPDRDLSSPRCRLRAGARPRLQRRRAC